MNSTYISELEKIILIYGAITFIDETNNNNEIDLVTSQKNVKYNIEKDIYRDKFELELVKIKGEEKIEKTFFNTHNKKR